MLIAALVTAVAILAVYCINLQQQHKKELEMIDKSVDYLYQRFIRYQLQNCKVLIHLSEHPFSREETIAGIKLKYSKGMGYYMLVNKDIEIDVMDKVFITKDGKSI